MNEIPAWVRRAADQIRDLGPHRERFLKYERNIVRITMSAAERCGSGWGYAELYFATGSMKTKAAELSCLGWLEDGGTSIDSVAQTNEIKLDLGISVKVDVDTRHYAVCDPKNIGRDVCEFMSHFSWIVEVKRAGAGEGKIINDIVRLSVLKAFAIKCRVDVQFAMLVVGGCSGSIQEACRCGTQWIPRNCRPVVFGISLDGRAEVLDYA